MDRSNKRALVVTALVLGAAVVTELRKSPDERTWHGKLAGVVPYDLRPPTLERVRSTVWNPDDPTFSCRTFSVSGGPSMLRRC